MKGKFSLFDVMIIIIQMEGGGMSNCTKEGCRPILIAKFRLKTDPHNDDAVSPGGMTSLQHTMERLRMNRDFLQQALAMDNWFAFAPNGKDDRIAGPSKYVLLAKVVCLCDLLTLMDTEKISWFELKDKPQKLHDYAMSYPEAALKILLEKERIRRIFTFRI